MTRMLKMMREESEREERESSSLSASVFGVREVYVVKGYFGEGEFMEDGSKRV